VERKHLLAAAIFSYSYSNYEDHLGINERFDRLMPHDAQILERAFKEQWSLEKVAKKLEVSADIANELLEATQWALDIVDAKNPAESFRIAVRQCIQYALEKGLDSSDSVEELVQQICYRAADLGLLLDKEGHRLSQYSRHLRWESDVEYYDGYFEEPFRE